MSIQEKLRYGATELKNVYTKNLGLALGISVGVHLALIFLYVFSTQIGNAGSEAKAPIVTSTKLTDLTPPPQKENTPPPPPPVMVPPQLQSGGGGGGVASRAGNPVPVPDALVAPDVKDFAATTELAVANSKAGDGTGFGNNSDSNGLGAAVPINEPVKVKETETEPDPDAFNPDLQLPTFDLTELQSRVKYPEILRNNGIEGQVVLKVLVDKTGHASKVQIVKSDNEQFSKAAEDAVSKTVFTPGIQNGTPVPAWLTFPVKFDMNQK